MGKCTLQNVSKAMVTHREQWPKSKYIKEKTVKKILVLTTGIVGIVLIAVVETSSGLVQNCWTIYREDYRFADVSKYISDCRELRQEYSKIDPSNLTDQQRELLREFDRLPITTDESRELHQYMYWLPRNPTDYTPADKIVFVLTVKKIGEAFAQMAGIADLS